MLQACAKTETRPALLTRMCRGWSLALNLLTKLRIFSKLPTSSSMNSTLLLPKEALMASVALQHAAAWELRGTRESSQHFCAHCGVASACLSRLPCMFCHCCGCSPMCVVPYCKAALGSTAAALHAACMQQLWHGTLEISPVSSNWLPGRCHNDVQAALSLEMNEEGGVELTSVPSQGLWPLK